MTDKEQLVTEGEARVVVKAADMAEDMQQEAINVAIEVRDLILTSVLAAWVCS